MVLLDVSGFVIPERSVSKLCIQLKVARTTGNLSMFNETGLFVDSSGMGIGTYCSEIQDLHWSALSLASSFLLANLPPGLSPPIHINSQDIHIQNLKYCAYATERPVQG